MAYPINYPSIYPKDFVNLVNSTKPDDFIGFGNPNAKILIIGKEQALDPNNSNSSILKDMNSCSNHNQWIGFLNSFRSKLNSAERDTILYEIETKQNHKDWYNIITGDTSCIIPYSIVNISGYPNVLTNKKKKLNPLQSAMVEWGKIFNPLWPYYELPSSADIKTWTSYQKLVYGTDSDFSTYCFWKDAFITEMSQVPSTTSKGISNSAVAASVNDRIDRILSHQFFKKFPYVVLACGDYIDVREIGKKGKKGENARLTNIKKMFGDEVVQTDSSKGKTDSPKGIRGIYKSNKQIIVNSCQLSMNWGSPEKIDSIRQKLGLIPLK